MNLPLSTEESRVLTWLSHKFDRVLLVVILILGLGVRLWQLGQDSFWNDEAGVALVALSPNLSGMLEAMDSHAMAMPLDYFITWLVIHFSLSELWLRLPAALFGVLSLLTCYLLFTRLANPRVARLAVLLLAISPLHIQFSQELRFYSSLIFFYNLSTLCFLIALEKRQRKYWAAYALVTALGIYFHIYTILAIFNGLAWIGLVHYQKKLPPRTLQHFMIAVVFLLLVFLSGYLFFGAGQKFNYSLIPWQKSFVHAIGQGLGWSEIKYSDAPSLGWVWYAGCFTLTITGLIACFRKRMGYTLALIASIILQVGMIIGADLVKNYFFSFRQLLQLHPFVIFLTALGVLEIGSALDNTLQRRLVKPKRIRWGSILLTLTLIFTSLPALIDYYKWPKSIAREVSQEIIRRWAPEDTILVIPGYSQKIYIYYLKYVYHRSDLASTIKPSNLTELSGATGNGEVFLIYIHEGQIPAETNVEEILSAGFQPVLPPDLKSWLGQSLFIK
jgi:uncharacterized membrane protein